MHIFFIVKAEIVKKKITILVQGVVGMIPIVESPLNAMKVAMEIS